MRYLRQIIAHLTTVRNWFSRRRHQAITRLYLNASHSLTHPFPVPIHRDVTPQGVRVYSLCACCGARLQASATLCEECAAKQSRSARPY
jgi:hypothetical protein